MTNCVLEVKPVRFNPERLRRARKSRNLTQRKLARMTRLSPAYISDLELGKTYPSITNHFKTVFAVFLGRPRFVF